MLDGEKLNRAPQELAALTFSAWSPLPTAPSLGCDELINIVIGSIQKVKKHSLPYPKVCSLNSTIGITLNFSLPS